MYHDCGCGLRFTHANTCKNGGATTAPISLFCSSSIRTSTCTRVETFLIYLPHEGKVRSAKASAFFLISSGFRSRLVVIGRDKER